MAGVACVLQEEARLNELGSGGACTTRTAAGLEKIKNRKFLLFRWQRARIFWFLLGFISGKEKATVLWLIFLKRSYDLPQFWGRSGLLVSGWRYGLVPD